MGVVYLATDTKLDRAVAIKALPVELAADETRLARFEREAKTLAQLSHPNLVAIHGVEEQDGARYLVLEYVEGETLADRLDAGPIPPEEAIDLAAQIAAGVAVAHAAGVVHRDLKPANIIITPDGQAKVLDFGLARQDEASVTSTSGALSQNPTLTSPAAKHSPTEAGVILGTAAYMSPEQARGRRVDQRTDVWSFGVLLFEMLTGVSPFVGETVSDSIGAVLHKQFDLDRLPVGTPPGVVRVLERALVRDRDARYRDLADLRLELLRAEAAPEEFSAGASRASLGVVGVLVVLAIALPVAAWLFKPMPAANDAEPLPVLAADLMLPGDDHLMHFFMPAVAITDDGQTVAFQGGLPDKLENFFDLHFAGTLKVRRMDQPGAVPVIGASADAWQPVFSPDGQSIAYADGVDAIATIPITGGSPVRLTQTESLPIGLCWGADGYIYYGGSDGLRRVSESGGPEEVLTTDDVLGILAFVTPEVTPDGRSVLYATIPSSRADEDYDLWILDLASGETTRLLKEATTPKFVNGRVLFARRSEVFSVGFEPESQALIGEPRPTGIDVIFSLNGPNVRAQTGVAQYDVSASGNLVYAPGTDWQEIPKPVTRLTREGVATELELEPRDYAVVRHEPNGRRVMAGVYHAPTSAVWVHDPRRGVTRRALGGVDVVLHPIWGPGPDQVTYTNKAPDTGRERLAYLDFGAATPTEIPIPDDVSSAVPAQWFAESTRLLAVFLGDFGHDLAVWSEQDGWARVADTPEIYEFNPALSPDERWLAYISDETGRPELFVRPIAGEGPVTQLTDDGASSPVWSADGTELFYRVGDSSRAEVKYMASVTVTQTESGLDFGPEVKLFDESNYTRTMPSRGWDITPDGEFLLIQRVTQEQRDQVFEDFYPDRLRFVQNWAASLGE